MFDVVRLHPLVPRFDTVEQALAACATEP